MRQEVFCRQAGPHEQGFFQCGSALDPGGGAISVRTIYAIYRMALNLPAHPHILRLLPARMESSGLLFVHESTSAHSGTLKRC